MIRLKRMSLVATALAALPFVGWYCLYRAAQERPDSFLGRAAATMYESSLKWGFLGWNYVETNKGRDRVSDFMREHYGTPDLSGYAASPEARDHDHFMLNAADKVLPKFDGLTIVEVGCAAGRNLAVLGERYPDRRYIGVDFDTTKAIEFFGDRRNIEFRSGYALDMIEAGSLSGDALFTLSTACLMLPNELRRFLAATYGAGFRKVVLVEPVFYGEKVTGNARSVHQMIGVWFHDYAGYLGEAGYEIEFIGSEVFRPGDPKHIRCWTVIGSHD